LDGPAGQINRDSAHGPTEEKNVYTKYLTLPTVAAVSLSLVDLLPENELCEG
jgi:hypothetical protein